MNIKAEGGGWRRWLEIFLSAYQLIHNLDALLPGGQELTGFQSQMWFNFFNFCFKQKWTWILWVNLHIFLIAELGTIQYK